MVSHEVIVTFEVRPNVMASVPGQPTTVDRWRWECSCGEHGHRELTEAVARFAGDVHLARQRPKVSEWAGRRGAF